MFNIKRLLFVLLFFGIQNGWAQSACTALGQNPGTAFPVCGTSVFNIASVPICGIKDVPNPAKCTAVQFNDKNPFWYKFTCFAAGTLGFKLTPNTLTDDYDWQLFDITNHNPDDVYTDPTLFVSCNWSGRTGITGTSVSATDLVECDTDVPIFSKLPTLIEGHQYLLLVSHFSDSQSGYGLSFSGGTASITDSVAPLMQQAAGSCDGGSVIVKLNKKMRCSSLAADGSDFSIGGNIVITGATGFGCSNGFDLDSVTLKFATPLPSGNYTVTVKTGTDGDNLLDYCGNELPDGQTIPFSIASFTPFDSIAPVGCAPGELKLVFSNSISCSSIAADGSDFAITGSTPVTIAGASGDCTGDATNIIHLRLSAPMQTAGNYKVTLKTGSDGNAITNACGVPTPAGASVDFSTADTVSAVFTTQVKIGCIADTINYIHDGKNGVTSWKWSTDNNINSISRDTTIIWKNFGPKEATLIVTNGVCSDTATSEVVLGDKVKAAFEGTNVVCPGDVATFKNLSIGPIFSWNWNFGNNNTSRDSTPSQQSYLPGIRVLDIPVQLIVKSLDGCADTAVHTIRVPNNCFIAIPKGFSPNNDGLNDYLYPTNAYKAKDLLFRVYNRGGQLIFETRDWTNKWDGSFKGSPQDPGTYVWILIYTDSETGQHYQQKGSTVLLR